MIAPEDRHRLSNASWWRGSSNGDVARSSCAKPPVELVRLDRRRLTETLAQALDAIAHPQD